MPRPGGWERKQPIVQVCGGCPRAIAVQLSLPRSHARRFKQQLQVVQQAVAAPVGVPISRGADGAAAGGSASGGPSPRVAGEEPAPPQYMQLPIESAKRLRWYDKQDLNMLIQARARAWELCVCGGVRRHVRRARRLTPTPPHPPPPWPSQLHLREKQELFDANSALRQVLRKRGVGDAALAAEVSAIDAAVDQARGGLGWGWRPW